MSVVRIHFLCKSKMESECSKLNFNQSKFSVRVYERESLAIKRNAHRPDLIQKQKKNKTENEKKTNQINGEKQAAKNTVEI